MAVYKLTNGRSVQISALSGEVIDSSKTQSTRIEQDAPTVLSKDVVVPGQIRSRTDVLTEVWLKLPDGQEKSFDLRNIGVPIRPGHRMSVLWASPDGRKTGWFVGSRNHTTKQSKVDLLRAVSSDAAYFKLNTGGDWLVVAGFLAFIFGGAIAGLVMSESREIAQRIVVGGLLGFVISLLFGIPMINMVKVPRVRRAVEEIEAFGEVFLSERDSA